MVSMTDQTLLQPNSAATAPAEAGAYVVEMRGIVKSFPGVLALDHVDFHLRPGELRALVGKNGAGKSTLINALTGVYPIDGGAIILQGRSYASMTTSLSTQLGIQCVHQHSQLVPSLSIAENVFCGNLPTSRWGVVDWTRAFADAEARLNQLGLGIDVHRKVEGLSVAERQIIEIAKALFADAQVIILDEATAPLPKNEVRMLFDFVEQQQRRGVAFIYISHYLEEIFELCDTVTVMRDGRNLGDFEVSALDQPELIRLISGTQLEQFSRVRRAPAATAQQPVVLEVEHLQREGAYTDVNLTLRRGEIVGLTGLEGSGKDALARGLFGLEPVGDGKVALDGKTYHATDPREALMLGLAYLPRDRHGLGIVGIRPVRENITLPILRQLRNGLGLIAGPRERSLVQQLIDKLNIKTPTQEQPVEFLSGGNQQKVVFAKLTSVNPRVLLLDEPTQGVDVQAKVEILRIVDHLAQEGAAVVVITEEIRELLDICDRILVMFKGRIVREFPVPHADTSVESILNAIEGSAAEATIAA